jgi:hypothetical protein
MTATWKGGGRGEKKGRREEGDRRQETGDRRQKQGEKGRGGVCKAATRKF